MTQEEKCEALASKTVEVDVRLYVRTEDAAKFEAAMLKFAKTLPGYVANSGGYTDSAEYHEVEEMIGNMTDTESDALVASL